MVAVEVGDAGVQVTGTLPHLRDHHGHGVGGRAATTHQQLQDLVQPCGVRTGLVDDGLQQVLAGVAELGPVRTEVAHAGPHEVGVALDGVDLAVVAQEAERLRPIPRRHRVGGVPLVEDREPAVDIVAGQVGVEGSQLVGGGHALVGDRAHRPGREVGLDAFGVAGGLGCLAGQVAGALGRFVVGAGVSGEDRLLDVGAGGPGDVPEGGIVGGDLAPGDEGQPETGQGVLHGRADRLARRLAPLVVTTVEEAHRGAEAGVVGHRGGGGEEPGRQRDQHACAVTGAAVGGHRTAVHDTGQPVQRVVDDLSAGGAAGVGDEADATGVAFVPGVVKASHVPPRGSDGVTRTAGRSRKQENGACLNGRAPLLALTGILAGDVCVHAIGHRSSPSP